MRCSLKQAATRRLACRCRAQQWLSGLLWRYCREELCIHYTSMRPSMSLHLFTTQHCIMSSTKIIDLSHALHPNMQTYPGDPPFVSSCATSIARDGYAVTALSLSSHTGTHIDAPAHFVDGGRTVEQLALTELIGRAVVVDVSSSVAQRGKAISLTDIQHALELVWPNRDLYATPMPMLLIHTGWDQHWDSTDAYLAHPFLSRDAVEYIVNLGFRVVGIDALSPDETSEEEGSSFAAHETILGADGIIAENLTNLGALGNGAQFTVCLVPLKIDGCDGSPVRAYAVRD
ncbi:hypothetical protein C8F01DRAFT_260759 [Mycena amicta]|nr:hypothetical protein C8F01DRAFT_260759 [Mycena amicta]